jgi:hypothetical protein
MNQEKKNALISILFYAISILIIIAINVSGKFKSGPCTPNLDILSVFILVVLNIILLVINGIKAFVIKKQTNLSFVIHFVFLIIWIICINCKVV